MIRAGCFFLFLFLASTGARSDILVSSDSIDSFRTISNGWLSSVVGTESKFIESPVAVTARNNIVYFIDDRLMGLYAYDRVAQSARSLKSVYAKLTRNPARLFLSEDNELFVIDSFGSQVLRYDLMGNFIARYSNPLNLNSPVGMCINPINQNVLIADSFYSHLIEFSPSGQAIELHGFKGAGETPAGNHIIGMACGEKSVFIVSKFSSDINVFSYSGKFLYKISRPEARNPTAIAVDQFDRVYISDDFDDQIKIYDDSGLTSRFGGSGSDASHFRSIKDLWIDGDELYVADNMNRRIQVFLINPIVSKSDSNAN